MKGEPRMTRVAAIKSTENKYTILIDDHSDMKPEPQNFKDDPVKNQAALENGFQNEAPVEGYYEKMSKRPLIWMAAQRKN